MIEQSYNAKHTQAYADGYTAGYLQATLRAESRQELGLPLVLTAEDDETPRGVKTVTATLPS